MHRRLSSILFFAIAIALSACFSQDETSIDSSPRGTLEEYIEANDVNGYTITDSGLYYEVLSEGDTAVLETSDVVDYYLAFYTMNGDLIFDGFDEQTLWITSLGEDAISIQGVIEAFLLNNIDDSLSLLVPNELAYGSAGLNGFVNPDEDLRVIVKAKSTSLSPLEYIQANDIEDYFGTSSGLYYTFDNEGEGDLPATGQTVEVHYTGYLFDGTKFDSSVDREATFSFVLGVGSVIAGWDEGIALFKKGQSGTLYMPYDLGYGLLGTGDVIAPYDNLLFEVELIDIR